MPGKDRIATPEELAAYAAKALTVHDLVCDAATGRFYIIAKRSRLELETVIAVEFREVATLGITFMQVMTQVHALLNKQQGKGSTIQVPGDLKIT